MIQKYTDFSPTLPLIAEQIENLVLKLQEIVTEKTTINWYDSNWQLNLAFKIARFII